MKIITLNTKEIRYLIRISFLASGQVNQRVDVDQLLSKRHKLHLQTLRVLRAKGLLNLEFKGQVMTHVSLKDQYKFSSLENN